MRNIKLLMALVMGLGIASTAFCGSVEVAPAQPPLAWVRNGAFTQNINSVVEQLKMAIDGIYAITRSLDNDTPVDDSVVLEYLPDLQKNLRRFKNTAPELIKQLEQYTKPQLKSIDL